MWSDSIFTDFDRSKMHRLVAIIRAAYRGGLSAVRELEPDAMLEAVLPVPQGGTYSMRIEGEGIVIIVGTTTVEEYLSQAAGYAVPHDGINALYWTLSGHVFSAIPNDTTLIVGHSMGGAIAACTARRMKAAGLSCRSLGFGSPRFARRPADRDVAWSGNLTVYHPYDLVSLIPPRTSVTSDWRVPGLAAWFSGDSLEVRDQFQSVVSMYHDIAWNHGVGYHDIGVYESLLANEPVTIPFSGSENVDLYYLLTVNAVYHEQRIMNSFWYRYTHPQPSLFGAENSATALAEDFRARYRAMILPRLSIDLSVLNYTAKKLHSFALANPAQLDEGSNPRWSEVIGLPGTALDVGIIASGTAFPSFVAVGYQKQCGLWYRPTEGFSEFVEGEKQPKGSFRIAGIAEVNTVTPHNNKISPNNLLGWSQAGEALRIIPPSTGVSTATKWEMVIARNMANSLALVNEEVPPFTGAVQFAKVNRTLVNPYLTSQNSRKQTIHRLG